MRLFLLALLVAAPAQAPPFDHSVTRLTPAQLPHSWRAGCPVAPAQLRRVRLTYWGFDGQAHSGSLVVHADVAQEIVKVFRRLYDARFPIRRMRPVDAYGADDHRSMAADNTSAFNCRVVAGHATWSAHAYGRAIDVNPVENPYLSGEPRAAPVGPRLPRPLEGASRHGRAGGITGAGVRRDRLVVGRALAGHAGLPALLGDGRLGGVGARRDQRGRRYGRSG